MSNYTSKKVNFMMNTIEIHVNKILGSSYKPFEYSFSIPNFAKANQRNSSQISTEYRIIFFKNLSIFKNVTLVLTF